MNVLAIAIAGCLCAQLNPRYEPQLERRKAPPASIDSEGLDDPPRRGRSTDSALGAREGDDNDSPSLGSQRNRVDDDQDLAPVQRNADRKMYPPELLAEALAKPEQGALRGNPLTLATALARSNDRAQQLKIAQCYWKLCTAQAGYHWALDGRERLKQYTEGHTSMRETLSARATARARVMDSQLAVAAAQQELADLLGAKPDEELPLATDRPHVGPYDTAYDALVASGRTPPPRLRLINRTLPIRRRAIDLHGDAILTGLDSLTAAGEDFDADQGRLPTLLSALDLLNSERTAFLGAVRQYNQDIAEYLFAVLPANSNAQALASKLILKRERGGTTGDRRSGTRSSTDGDPDDPLDDAQDGRRREQSSQYQPLSDGQSLTEQGLYAGLADLKPPVHAQKLAGVLHWTRDLPSDSGRPVALLECLQLTAPANRAALIAAYWQTRERVARYQAVVDQTEQLNALATVAIAHRRHPEVAQAGVRLQAARLAAQAALAEAHVALLASQFDLTQRSGRRLDEAWLLPTTAPQSGGYDLGNQSARRQPHRAATVHLQHAKMQERAHAIIRIDDYRASIVNQARGPADGAEATGHLSPLDGAMWASLRQYNETLGFLRDLTEYNVAIARYVLAVMPQSVSNDELVKLLVIARTTRGEA